MAKNTPKPVPGLLLGLPAFWLKMPNNKTIIPDITPNTN
jgi:hypothetical protein